MGAPVLFRQRSVRCGLWSRLMVIRVYLPMRPGWEMRISRITPLLRNRSRVVSASRSVGPTVRMSVLIGQPWPRHRTDTVASAGARTANSLTIAPSIVYLPAICRVGKGRISGIGAALTWTVALAMLDVPAVSVTCRRTTWGPGLAKEVLCSGPAGAKLPLPVSQAYPAVGVDPSVDVDISHTASPTRGCAGKNVNDAVGGVDGEAAGCPETVAGATLAAGPDVAGLGATGSEAVVSPVEDGVDAGSPLVGASPAGGVFVGSGSLPPVEEPDGGSLPVEEPPLIVHDTGRLEPCCPAALVCVAITV